MKILFLAANPSSTTRLKLDEEVRAIEKGLESSKLRDEFELVQRWAVRSKDIRRALLRENPDIVHFSGHGKGQAGLVIMDEVEQAKPATGEALAGLFSLFPNIKCVLLNACYAEVQAQAIVQKIDYVIGMRDTILDDAAIAFTTGFYDGLGYGRSIEDAFKLGQNAILWELASFSDVTRQLIPVEFVNNESSASLLEHLKPILLKKAIPRQEITENKVNKRDYADLRSNKLKKYRERVQEYIAKRRLNPIAKFQLATLAKELEISESEANKIWKEELGKIDEAKENYRKLLIKTIGNGYDPLNSQIEQELKNLQKSLKLTDSEVAEITRPILEEAERQGQQQEVEERLGQQQEVERELRQREKAERSRQQQEIQTRRQQEAITIPTPITRKQFLKWVGLGGGGLVTTILLSQILKKESDSIKKQPVTKTKPISPREGETKAFKLPLQKMDFKTVTVDDKGQEVKRESGQARYFKEDLGNSISLDMVKIPGGSFLMGTEESEIERLVKKFNVELFRKERPQHKVTVKPFFLGKYQVTQAQWKAIASLPKVNRDLTPDPSKFKGDNLPVELVSWDDAIEFCQRLSLQTGREYRLPSEAEWEYACRAGTTTPFYFGETITGELANYRASRTYANELKGEYRSKTTPVGSFPASAFGLYDMHGQVWEWCEDDYHNSYEGAPTDGSAWISGSNSNKVIRGGSWFDYPGYCRSAYRYYYTRDYRYSPVGVRVVCVVPRTT